MKIKFTLSIAALIFLAKCADKESDQMKLTYPETKKMDISDNYFGTDVSDPYRWLENDTSSETEAWVKAQNKVTDQYLNSIPYKEKIKNRYTELYNYEKVSSPRKIGNYFFYYKNDGLQDQSIIYYKNQNTGEEKVFIDPNKLSDEGTVAISLLGNSSDYKYLAYSASVAGSDWREIRVREVETNKELEDVLTWVKFSGASWYKDGFFYSRYPENKSGNELSGKNEYHTVYYHKLGTPQPEDIIIHQNKQSPDLLYFCSVTEDKNWVVLYEQQGTEDLNVYFKETKKLKDPFQPLITGFTGSHSVIDYHDGKFYMHTNEDAPNYKLVAFDPSKVDKENWETIIPEKDNYLQGVSTAGERLFAQYLKSARSEIICLDYKGNKIREINLPGLGSAGGFNGEKTDKVTYYGFSSFTNPQSIYQLDIETGKTTPFFTPKLTFDPSKYVEKQVFYKSKDGTDVSMFIVHKKGLNLDGNNPTLLYGYGGFNISLSPWFSTSRIVLLENDGVFAMPNLRGGGEYGEKWHEAGMKMNKQNVFDDFIAAAEYLIAKKYTSKDKLAINGGSNGGLLVGACMTQRPDLFKVAIPQVGVLDMLRFHKFTIGYAWTPEYGHSEENKEMFSYLYNYSPVHNLKEGVSYPATLITTADHDDRVVPAHSFKFAATLQEKHKGNNPVLISIQTKAGHGAGKPVSKIIEEEAEKWAFVFWNMEYKELY